MFTQPNSSTVASNLKLNETGKNIKSKLELASFRVLHGTTDTSRHEKFDCCAVVQHNYRPACSRPCSRGPDCAVVQSAFSETDPVTDLTAVTINRP